MTFTHPETFRPIGQILAMDVLPALCRAQNLPLRISCFGVASHDAGGAAERFNCVIPLDECPTPEEAMSLASLRLSRGEICTRSDSFQLFRPRIIFIQDRAQRLVLAGRLWLTMQARNACRKGSVAPSLARRSLTSKRSRGC